MTSSYKQPKPMTPARMQRVRALFEKATSCEPKEAAALLDEACGDDTELREEVESLLRHSRQADPGFMRVAERPDTGGFLDMPGTDPLLGKQVGGCELLRIVGVGGMGVVYEAKQASPARTVAVKILRHLQWSREARRRFDFETRILARLSHPHIAQVYHTGTHEKQPYFVMEFIHGAVPITEYAERAGLSIEGKLRLMLQVCEAVEHGHQKGVIHRDLKPGNILVNAEGYVKVIDFGVARSTDSDVATTTMQTDVGQLIGTLQYMSPEQCQADPLGIDIRSDVYSLGIVLYELLCGQPPYDVSHTTITRAAWTICEQPPTPPRDFQPKFHRLLQLLTLKALEKKREDRYQSAAELARDIRHYLNDEPIEAKPPTVWDRAGRWLARHPVLATTFASASVAILMLLSGYFAYQYAFQKPHEVVKTTDGRSVELLSRNGNTLDVIENEKEVAVSFAKLLTQTGLADGKQLVVVGFSQLADPLRARTVSLYDVSNGQFNEPLWRSSIMKDEIPVEGGDGFEAADFAPEESALRLVADIFPEHLGVELVLTFSHYRSRRALRIYGLDGKVLYEVWHDGEMTSVVWLSAAKVLVVAGRNCEVDPKDRGLTDMKSSGPYVFFALKPTLGERHTAYVRPYPKEGDVAALWYKAILPANAADVLKSPVIQPPQAATFMDGRHFETTMRYKDQAMCTFNQVIDEHGTIVDVKGGDNYRQLDTKPTPSAKDIHLGPVPKVLK